jgi:subtilisin-like proprotein convertase family protein
VAPDMEFTGVSASDYQICVGDTITLQASTVPTTAAFLPPSIRSDSLFLPDGTGGSVQTGIGFTQFEPGAVLTNISDLQGICVNMEHSWMRDIEIKIKCPNGTTVTLLNQVTVGGEVFMGIPNESDGGSGSGGAQNPPGTGYTYCWTPNATQGTMLEYANNTGVHDLPDNVDYESYQTLNNLIGCPLNGDWQIIVKDNWGSDNGWVFSWGIDFNPLLFPNLEVFTPAIVSEEWTQNSTFVTNNGHTATVSPQVPGTASYTYVAENEYGCTYDTTINVVVLPANDPQCFSCGQVQITNLTDTTICQGQSVVLSPQSSVGGSQSTFGNSSASAVPDNGFLTNNPLNAQVNVSGLPFTAIANGSIASVCINIDHNNVSDMDVYLISPCGQSLELSTDNGGSGDDYVNACFTPTATQPIAGLTSAATPFNGTYLPEGNFSTFNGCNPNGTWTLRVFDDANGISGTLLGFTIVFNTPSTATYTWSPATGLSCTDCPNPTANPSTSTTYLVTVSDANSCSGTADVAINVNTPQSAPIVTCSGSTVSSVTFSWLGTGNYEVSLNGGTSWIPANGINSHTVTGLTVGQSVTIEVRQTGGTAICPSPIGTGTCTASLCNLSGNLLSITHETCAGDNDGSITLSGTGGTQPYTYTLNTTTQSSGSFNNLPPAAYVAIVTDATGCVSTIANNINIVAATVLTASATSTSVSCFGSADATATVTPQGGTGVYTYLWSTTPVQTGISATGLTAATYTVTVTDANGCSTTTSTTISTPTQLGSSVTVTDATCTVGNDGSATVSATGGQIPYTYNWSNGQTGATVSGLSGGAYTVTVRDANGCTTTNLATINQPTSLNVTATAVDVACNSGTDGSISLTITGGNPPLTFNWSSGQSIQDITNLAAGSYTVTVTDGSGCRAVVSASVAEPTQLTLSTSSTPASCFGSLDGSASVMAQGGTGIYTYLWSSTPAQTGATAIGLAAANYTVTVTDANGCSMTGTSVVTQPTQMITSMTSTDVLCAGNSDGTATVSTIGGQQPYTYLWNYNAQTSATITNIPAGAYQVTVTDANGCKATHAASIAQPQPLLATMQATDITCAGASDGNISLTVSAGTAPYTFNWSNGETTQNIQNLNAGTYDVTITDNNGCIRIITNISLTEPTPLTVSSSSTPAACNGRCKWYRYGNCARRCNTLYLLVGCQRFQSDNFDGDEFTSKYV